MLASLALLLALAAGSGRQDYSAPRNATVDAHGATRLELQGAAGLLRVTGVARLQEVRVRGTARTSDRRMLDEIRLVARREGDVVVIRADLPQNDDYDGERALDLELEVPFGIAATIAKGSGAATLQGLGDVQMSKGSGTLDVHDVGDFRLVSGSAGVTLRGARGNVSLRSGSGTVSLTDVQGSITVESSGSGTLEASHVDGSVLVHRKGSGSIGVHDVGGNFVVEQKGSGSIDYDGVKGAVRLPARWAARRGGRDW